METLMSVITYPKVDTRTAKHIVTLVERLGNLIARQSGTNDAAVGEALDIRNDARKLIAYLDSEEQKLMPVVKVQVNPKCPRCYRPMTVPAPILRDLGPWYCNHCRIHSDGKRE